jgi:glycosyltransferase involved in cell wall biosynthesis
MNKIYRQIVFLDDNLTTLLKKGEIIDNYYNIGQFFDEVTVITINNSRISEANLSRILGTLKCSQVNLKISRAYFFLTLGYQPVLTYFFLKRKLNLINKMSVDLVRSYGSRIGAFLGTVYAEKYNLPHIISLHENFDSDYRYNLNKNIFRYLYVNSFRLISAYALRKSNHVVIVYNSISKYLDRISVSNYSLIYNFIPIKELDVPRPLNPDSNNLRLVWIGRLVPEKNPINIIRAIKELDSFTLDIVGIGPIKANLLDYVRKLNLDTRIRFIDSIPNHSVISAIKKYDLFVANIKFFGIPKTVIEAMHAGVPIIINKPTQGVVYEYSNGVVKLVDDSTEGYKGALMDYIYNTEQYQEMAKKAFDFANLTFDYNQQLKKYVTLLEGLIE